MILALNPDIHLNLCGVTGGHLRVMSWTVTWADKQLVSNDMKLSRVAYMTVI